MDYVTRYVSTINGDELHDKIKKNAEGTILIVPLLFSSFRKEGLIP